MTKKACEKWYSAFRSFPRFFEIFPSLVNQDTKDRLKKNKGKRRGKGEGGTSSLHNRGFSNFVVRNYLSYPLLGKKKKEED